VPQKYIDAIKIAQALNIRCLWVDALCIIQDSKEDWKKEALNMGNVYNNAMIPIQASGTDHSNGGCFIQRHPPSLPPTLLKFRSNDEPPGKVFVRSESLSSRHVANPISKRGWTLQESILLPRILSFGAKYISWECKSTYVDEIRSVLAHQEFGAGLPKPIRTSDKIHVLPSHFDLAVPDLGMALTWSYIIREFSQRRLTYPRDKLPAISGLAKYLSEARPGDDY